METRRASAPQFTQGHTCRVLVASGVAPMFPESGENAMNPPGTAVAKHPTGEPIPN